jgi:hypothetical protein
MYKTRGRVLDFLLGWIKALRWQRLPEMERLGEILFRHIEGIARTAIIAYDLVSSSR